MQKTETLDQITNSRLFLYLVAGMNKKIKEAFAGANFEITVLDDFEENNQVKVEKIKPLGKLLAANPSTIFLNIYSKETPSYSLNRNAAGGLTHVFTITPGTGSKVRLTPVTQNPKKAVLFKNVDCAIQAAAEIASEKNKLFEKFSTIRDKIKILEKEIKVEEKQSNAVVKKLIARLHGRTIERERD